MCGGAIPGKELRSRARRESLSIDHKRRVFDSFARYRAKREGEGWMGASNRASTVFSVCFWGSILKGCAVCCTAMPAVDTAEASMSPEVCGFWLNWATALERANNAFT